MADLLADGQYVWPTLTEHGACIRRVSKVHQKEVACSAELSRATSICHFLPLDSLDHGEIARCAASSLEGELSESIYSPFAGDPVRP